MSKPTKNRVMCPECFRAKMLFDTQKQADNFIKWNGEDIDTQGGELRSYYCKACGGWHITSKPPKAHYEHSTETLINRYKKDTVLNDSKIVELPELSEKAKNILDNLPKNVNSKTKLRTYLNEYFKENEPSSHGEEVSIRSELYNLIRNKQYDIRLHVKEGKLVSDEDIFSLIYDKYKVSLTTFKSGLNGFAVKHNVFISKDQRKRLYEMFNEYLKNKEKDEQ